MSMQKIIAIADSLVKGWEVTFNVEFDERAFKEWNKLEKTIREQFKKKLKKLQQNLYVESSRLHGDLAGCFKIKLRAPGVRLIYKVIDDEIVIWGAQ